MFKFLLTYCEELHQQEKSARDHVRLPYEHQGQGSRFQTSDYRDYLPGPAGGHAGRQHPLDADEQQQVSRLGRIHYVRDSEEEHDSDEDPDDDLDI